MSGRFWPVLAGFSQVKPANRSVSKPPGARSQTPSAPDLTSVESGWIAPLPASGIGNGPATLHRLGHGRTWVRPSRFYDCADLRECGVSRWLAGWPTCRPWLTDHGQPDVIWRRTGVVCRKLDASLFIFPLYNIRRFADFVTELLQFPDENIRNILSSIEKKYFPKIFPAAIVRMVERLRGAQRASVGWVKPNSSFNRYIWRVSRTLRTRSDRVGLR